MEKDNYYFFLLNRIEKLEKTVEKLQTKIDAFEGKTQEKSYCKLSEYLKVSNIDKIQLSFGQFQKLLNYNLPQQAYEQNGFWTKANEYNIAHTWLNVGYKISSADLQNQIITFELKA